MDGTQTYCKAVHIQKTGKCFENRNIDACSLLDQKLPKGKVPT